MQSSCGHTGQLDSRYSSAFGEARGLGPSNEAQFGSAIGGGETLDLTRRGEAATKIMVSADASNNSVITYTDGDTYRKVHATLRQLDSAPLQVAVNVTIAEVQLNEQLRFGIQYFLNVGRGKRSGNEEAGSFGLIAQTANVLTQQIPGFNFVVGARSAPDVVISALDGITDVKILSSPSLVVVENQTATLQVGDSIPITTRQAQSIENVAAPLINQIEFRDTGIILNVTPRIGQNDAVTMQIEQEISAVTGGTETLTPTISKRRVASNISVASGQTVLLAGLISDRTDRGRTGIPGLVDLPDIGALFGTNSRSKGRTELVVFIRPVVVRNGEDAASVAEEFRSRLRTAESGYKPVPYRAAPPLEPAPRGPVYKD